MSKSNFAVALATRPEVIILTRRSSRPKAPVVEPPKPPRWQGLRGAIAGEFRSKGRVFSDDEMTSARGERRVTR
jgi:hypothetical protein